MIFKKADNALLFWITICDLFWKYNTTGVFNQVQDKIYMVNFRKYRTRKKIRFGWVKMSKSIKIEKNEELMNW